MAGKIQNEDVKSLSELTGAGGVSSQLINDTKIYVSASSINKQLSQAIIDGDIGGGSGGINYISLSQSNGASASGWATYADAAGTSPVNGTGGSPSSTFATSTNSSLVGANNYLWTKSAANRQGEGFSYDFSIDSGYQSKPFSISFLYSISSGTYVDGDMTVWIYDVTNSVLIQPTAYSILNVTGVGVQKCEFQAASNSTSYRLIVHTSSTSASAYSLRFDSFSVGPNTYNFGSVVTEPVAYTPTFTGFGTVSTSNIRSWRVGANLHILGTFTSGTPTATEARISLGFGGVNGTVNSVSGLPTVQSVGNWFINSNGAATDSVLIESSVGYLTFGHGYTSGSPLTKANGNGMVGAGSIMSFYAIVPIAGWGTAQVLSSDTDTRVVAAKYTAPSQNITGSLAVVKYLTKSYDTHNAYNTSTGVYTVPVAGLYRVQSSIGSTANVAGTANQAVYMQVFKNGSADSEVARAQWGSTANFYLAPNGVVTINCVAGDTLEVRATQNTGNTWTTSADFTNAIAIERVSGPAQVAASETVSWEGHLTGNVNPGANAVLKFTASDSDSHNAYSASTGLYTVPTSGRYLVAAVALSTGAAGGLYVSQNGTAKKVICASNTSNYGGGSVVVRALAGDTLAFYSDTSMTLVAGSAPFQTTGSITRIGNY